ncbi:MAG: ATP-binding protein [Chloroflexota bacterium]
MTVFLNRATELAWLADSWGSGRAELRILYGRRRVGKSALLDEFAAGKRHVLYQAVEGTIADQLRDLTEAILTCQDDPVLRAAPLANWDAAFAYLARMAAERPLLVIFDEYQYAAEADVTLASRLQRWWSRQAVHLPIYLVLCGSYVRFFVKNVLTGPAYGRNTGALQLKPLSYRDAALFFPSWSREDQIRAYAVVGGVPHYLLQFDPSRPLTWNIQQNVLRRGAVLYQDAELLVREELREPRVYFSMLRAISGGATRQSQIATHVQGAASGSNLASYLATLQELGLTEYRRPVVGESVRRGIWTIADPYLRFWFRFVLPNQAQLEHGGSAERVYQTVVGPALDHFVAKPVFEDVCRAWVLDRVNRGEWLGVDRVGAWWGPIPDPQPGEPRRQTEGEIEVVGAAGKRVILAGEVKWTVERVGFGVLNHLRQVVRHVPGADDRTELVLFGRSFEPRLVDAADRERVRLVSLDDLYA